MQKADTTKFILVILLLPLFLVGCYDRHELDNLAYVIAIGADLSSGDNLDITYQIAIPVKMTGESSETGKSTYTTYTMSAQSLTLANTLINTKVSKRINLSHVKLIVYSEELAKNDLSGRINVFMSNSNIRPRATLVVCEGSAKNFLENISPELEASPSRYYELMFSTYNYTTQSEPTQLIDLYTNFESIDRNAFATYVKTNNESGDEKQTELRGIAAFDETHLAQIIIDNDFLLAHSILIGNLKQAGYTIPDFNRADRVISVQIVQNTNPNISVSLSGDVPHIKCNIELESNLVSSGSNINFYDKKNEKKLKYELDKSLEQRINDYFEKTIKEYKIDIAAIGKNAKRNFNTWQEFEKYKWLSKYPNSTYEVKVDTKLNISQIISHIVPNAKK